MGIKRIVDVSFWNDEKVLDCFSPDDKYFMLYLLTNMHTTQLGIYRLNKNKAAFEVGYTREAIEVLMERFEKQYKIIKYNKTTQEIAVLNYLRYAIVKGGKPVEDCIKRNAEDVKDKALIKCLYPAIKSYKTTCEGDKQNIYDFLRNFLLSFNDNDNDNDNDVSYHDTYNDTYNDTSIIKSKKVKASPKKDTKHIHGEYKHVLLTEKQHLKLIKDFGEVKTAQLIKNLDEGIQLKGYKYKDCNLAIRKWAKGNADTSTNLKAKVPQHNFEQRDHVSSDFDKYINQG